MATTNLHKHTSTSTATARKPEPAKTANKSEATQAASKTTSSKTTGKPDPSKKASTIPSRPKHITGERSHYCPDGLRHLGHPHLTFVEDLDIEEDEEVTCHPHLTFFGHLEPREDESEGGGESEDELEIDELRQHGRSKTGKSVTRKHK